MYTAVHRVLPARKSIVEFSWASATRQIIAGCMLLVVSQSPGLAQDWSGWRGPEQNGISRETNLVDDWSLEPPRNVAWTSDIGGRATPIVLNGKVYLNCRTDDDVNDPEEK